MNEQKQNQPKKILTAKKKQEITSALNHFYNNPVAKVSLELFLTIGLVLFLGMFAIRPTLLTMSDLLKEIETKQELEEKLTKKVAALQTAQSEYVAVEQRLGILDRAIPENPEVIYAAKIIEKIAADNQIIISNLNISELPEKADSEIPFSQKSKQSVQISIRVDGDYISIRNFAEDLRRSQKSFVIESVIFTLEEDRGDKKLGATFTISTPYFGIENTDKTAQK